MRIAAAVFITSLLAAAHAASAADCVGARAIQGGPGIDGLINNASANPNKNVDCSSLISVLQKISRRTVTGGRKLENDKPFDPQAAQANLAAAMRDANVAPRIKQVQGEVRDGNLRLLYEAAILDEEGFYPARDLRVQQLQQQLH